MDESIRELERRANGGDAEAAEALKRLRERAGLSESASEVLAELSRLERERAALRADFRAAGRDELERYLTAAFAREPELAPVRIRGYTPGFLDGDLCEHSQSVVVGFSGDGADDDDDDDRGLSTPSARALEAALGEFEPILQLEHGTDWQLLVRPGPDGLVWDERSWSCGY